MSSTRFRKRDEALGAVLRDMATAKYVAADAGAPHSPKGSQVERRGQYGPLGRHVCQTSQEEPPARLLLLDNPEHRLDRLLPQLVRRFRGRVTMGQICTLGFLGCGRGAGYPGGMSRKPYPSDLTDAQWEELAPLLPPDTTRGHPRTTDLREVVNGILYVLRGGIPWRLMPHDLPPWGTVWWYFRKWRDDGTWERVEETLRARVREAAGREATPSAAIIDSQSVKTTEKGGRGAMTRVNGLPDASGTL